MSSLLNVYKQQQAIQGSLITLALTPQEEIVFHQAKNFMIEPFSKRELRKMSYQKFQKESISRRENKTARFLNSKRYSKNLKYAFARLPAVQETEHGLSWALNNFATEELKVFIATLPSGRLKNLQPIFKNSYLEWEHVKALLKKKTNTYSRIELLETIRNQKPNIIKYEDLLTNYQTYFLTPEEVFSFVIKQYPEYEEFPLSWLQKIITTIEEPQ